MNDTLRARRLRAIAAACAALAAPAAFAQSPTPRLDTLTVDQPVTASCPDAAETLQNSLWKVVRDRGESGTVDVRMRLAGGQVVEVEPAGGPRGYHRGIRRAARSFECSGAGPDKVLHFRVRVDAGAGRPDSLALIDGGGPATR